MNEYECDECGEKFELGVDSFYGQLDGDTDCSPFTRLTALCPKCIDRSYKELAAMHTEKFDD